MKLEKFNYSGKRGRWFLYGVICTVLLLVLVNLFFSQAKYLKTESIKLAAGTMSYKPYDFKIMAMYQENSNGEYEEIEVMPTNSYVINEEKSYCTLDNVNKDSNAILKTIDGNHTISNLSKNDKCYLYFDIYNPYAARETILANMNTITTRNSFSTTYTSTTTETIFTAEDDYGTSYYYAGAPTDNWVKFAGFYWRIIRINGDGTIRMIFQGTATNATGTSTQTQTSAFNESYNNNMYVGYMYTSGQVHGLETVSTIKGVLDTWYNNNLASYNSNIATGNGATFCNDRQPSTSGTSLNGSGGTSQTWTVYAAYIRLYKGGSASSASPSLKCADSKDRFDTSIGLITADEVSYAGGVVDSANTGYYLYTSQYYWTMSPSVYNNGDAGVYYVHENGSLCSSKGVGWIDAGVRPVINLKADITFSSGNGTITDPYVVS